MVLLIMTRAGFDDVRTLIAPSSSPVWVNAGVLSDEEIGALRERGVDLSRFTMPHDLEQAIDIIVEHHPGERIWAEIIVATPDE